MGNLAVLLKEAGHHVHGSDASIFPPISTLLESNGILPDSGFVSAIPTNTDFVIIGNAISRGNKQLEQALSAKMDMLSMSEALGKFVIGKRHSIVVSGTHGKTTTTALTSHLLQTAGIDCGFFLGGVTNNTGNGSHFGKDQYFVTEGDEYDAAFFDKRSKFMHYSPETLLINNIEFDHADIFENLKAIKKTFIHLLKIVPQNGIIFANGDDKNIREVLLHANTPIRYFGFSKANDHRLRLHKNAPLTLQLDDHIYKLPHLSGKYNAYNAAAAILINQYCGNTNMAGLASFTGVAKRQQLLGKLAGGSEVYLDFAHHPTAIKLVLQDFRDRFADKKLAVVLEPRSNTMVRHFHQHKLIGALQNSDVLLIAELYREAKIPPEQKLNTSGLAEKLTATGVTVKVDLGYSNLYNEILSLSGPDTVIIILSNGNLGGVIPKISNACKKKK
jgi:UDP-N-acetylmuramate: L-alanyl-gamma-D-glutamyl-meso-diaminopimelate ligase